MTNYTFIKGLDIIYCRKCFPTAEWRRLRQKAAKGHILPENTDKGLTFN